MAFEVTILGSSSATPVFNRNPTAQLLNCNGNYYLIDCGEGTQQQLIRFGLKSNKINQIFISHLHGDHYFGLIGLLSSLHLNGRIKPMNVFGPAPLIDILQLQFLHSDTKLNFPLIFTAIDVDEPAEIFADKDLRVETIILNHRIPCTGFKFIEQTRSRRLDAEKLSEHEIPVTLFPLLKRGLDITLPSGETLMNADYTLDPVPTKCYAYCSDTLYTDTYFNSIGGCDLLYHEATFMHDMLARATQTHHSTALQAAEVAVKTGAKKLLIGHFSSRYKTLIPLLEEAKSVFPETELATEGRTFSI